MTLYFDLSYENNKFYAILDKSNNNWDLFVGGKIKGCIIIECRKNICTIEKVNYDQRCNIDGNMRNGSGTISMINAAIKFIFDYFPNIQEIQLKDHSIVICNTDKNKNIDIFLPHIQIIQYGKTWYERKINARLRNIKNYKYIDNFVNHITTKPDWNILWEFIKDEINVSDIIEYNTLIYNIWKNTNNFREMIIYMLKHKQCYLFVDWLDNYFIKYSKLSILNQYYIIERKNIDYGSVIVFNIIKNNPYIKNIDLKHKTQKTKLDSLNLFIPRTKYGGTRNTHGKLYINQMIKLDIL